MKYKVFKARYYLLISFRIISDFITVKSFVRLLYKFYKKILQVYPTGKLVQFIILECHHNYSILRKIPHIEHIFRYVPNSYIFCPDGNL